jgi:GntR family transcriptional regulator
MLVGIDQYRYIGLYQSIPNIALRFILCQLFACRFLGKVKKMLEDQPENREVNNNQFEFSDVERGKAERIMEEIGAEIREGKLQVGDKLSSERELADRFKVSRMTVRRALQTLLGEGMIVSYPVRGYFVVGTHERLKEYHGELVYTDSGMPSVAAEELRAAGSFYEYMKRLRRNPEVVFLEPPAIVAPNQEVVEHLQMKTSEPVFKRYRLQLADKLPYRLIESYYPSDLFSELLTTDIGTKPLFKWLQERHGLTAVRAREVLIARPANLYERGQLRFSPGAPVVALDRTVWADTGRIIEWARITASATLYTFMYEYDIHM